MAKRAYEMKIVVLVDDEHRQRVIDTARQQYRESDGAFRVDGDGGENRMTPEDIVDSIDDALMELVHSHPGFESAGIVVSEITCDTEENAQEYVDRSAEVDSEETPAVIEDELDDESETGELDEYETGVYLCRWPNGEFSVVAAPTRREAIIALDEWGGADRSYVQPISAFMADFGLSADGEIDLHAFGEETEAVIWDTCYPALQELFLRDDVTDDAGHIRPEARGLVQAAVEHERKRLWDSQPDDEASTEMGKRIAEQMGTSAVVADHYVKVRAQRILKSKMGEKGKPN